MQPLTTIRPPRSSVERHSPAGNEPTMPSDVVMQWLTQEDLAMKVVSYAQNHEDILLSRAFPDPNGLYIDVGANHPVFHSVTKLFAMRGWRGINIEPSPLLYQTLEQDRPYEINLNVGVGNETTTLSFFEVPAYHGWSSFRRELADHYRSIGVQVFERKVPVTTLREICAEHVGDRTIDFLKIDAEGFELQVIQGADFLTYRPRVLVIENAWHDAWEALVLGANYSLAAADGLNRFYVRGEEPDLLSAFATPVNILDNYVPFEFLRMIEYLNHDAARKFSFINAIRHDTPRLFRKARSIVRRFGSKRHVG